MTTLFCKTEKRKKKLIYCISLCPYSQIGKTFNVRSTGLFLLGTYSIIAWINFNIYDIILHHWMNKITNIENFTLYSKMPLVFKNYRLAEVNIYWFKKTATKKCCMWTKPTHKLYQLGLVRMKNGTGVCRMKVTKLFFFF